MQSFWSGQQTFFRKQLSFLQHHCSTVTSYVIPSLPYSDLTPPCWHGFADWCLGLLALVVLTQHTFPGQSLVRCQTWQKKSLLDGSKICMVQGGWVMRVNSTLIGDDPKIHALAARSAASCHVGQAMTKCQMRFRRHWWWNQISMQWKIGTGAARQQSHLCNESMADTQDSGPRAYGKWMEMNEHEVRVFACFPE